MKYEIPDMERAIQSLRKAGYVLHHDGNVLPSPVPFDYPFHDSSALIFNCGPNKGSLEFPCNPDLRMHQDIIRHAIRLP